MGGVFRRHCKCRRPALFAARRGEKRGWRWLAVSGRAQGTTMVPLSPSKHGGGRCTAAVLGLRVGEEKKQRRERAIRGWGRVKEEKEKGSLVNLLKCPSLSLFFCSKLFKNRYC